MTCRILVVEEHPAFCKITLQLLRKRGGHEVTAVGTALTGRRVLLEARQFEPDIILIALSGPDLSGLALILHVRRVLPKVKIIAMTLLDVETYLDVVLAAGADDLISKATFTQELMPAIWRQTAPSAGATLEL
jgi:two-component system invasion response regulator UvrY